jgi:hypothetical protein
MKFAAIALFASLSFAASKPKPGDWRPMFDGATLDGWKANERPESWTVRNGNITGDGPASHLFYMNELCVNCEFKAQVKINHGGNSGMYFRTAFGPGFPRGYEAQVDNTHTDPVRTGSLYNFVKVFEQLIPDDTWWTQHIIVEGNHIQIFVNDKKTVDFIDEKNTFTNGHLALQQHNAGSVVEFKDLMIRQLPPPSSPLAGTWKMSMEQSKIATPAPKSVDAHILEERDALRWQFNIVLADNKRATYNFWARNDGYDYVATSPAFDHVSIQEVGRNRKHEALHSVKLRKATDEHHYEMEQKVGRKVVDRSLLTVSADGKTLLVAVTKIAPDGTTTEYSEVFSKVE